jgi:hypothetical protein
MTQTSSDSQEVRVTVKSFDRLFAEAGLPLALDTYQRGFVWKDEKVDQLHEDLITHQQRGPETPPAYYMGTILLHKNEDEAKLYIIDGQQRLSALCVLHHALTGTLPPNCALSYSPESARNLQSAAGRFSQAQGKLKADIFKSIHFTLVTVKTVDLAFTFFDTQNNRGVPLQATDLMKAHHLRAIEGESREALQKQSAERWERLQHGDQVLGHGEDFAPALFEKFLWRSRAWVGQNDLRFESHDAVLEEFQRRTLPPSPLGANAIPLYRSHGNLLASQMRLSEGGTFVLEPRPIVLGASPAELPFALRQPISDGIGFFLYADKYAALVHEILHAKHPSDEVRAFCTFHEQVVAPLSVYLREAYLLACVMYVDQFGHGGLLEFALWLDYSIGSVRIDKSSIRTETARNYFGKRRVNLLDVIAGAFTPQQVIDRLKADKEAQAIYDSEVVVSGDFAPGRYKASVLHYFQKSEESLRGRKHWISEDFIAQRKKECPPCR